MTTLISVTLLVSVLVCMSISAPTPSWKSYQRDWEVPSASSYGARGSSPTQTPNANGNGNGESSECQYGLETVVPEFFSEFIQLTSLDVKQPVCLSLLS